MKYIKLITMLLMLRVFFIIPGSWSGAGIYLGSAYNSDIPEVMIRLDDGRVTNIEPDWIQKSKWVDIKESK